MLISGMACAETDAADKENQLRLENCGNELGLMDVMNLFVGKRHRTVEPIEV